jgi:branched-chain amino acid transport system permease protein
MPAATTSARRTLLGRFRDDHGLALWARLVVAVAALGAVWLASTTFMTNSAVFTLTSIATAALWASTLNIVVGFTGQLNLSLGAFISLGAYIGVLGTGFWGWSGITVLLVVIVSSLLIALLLSLVMFRARGLHFALLTAGLSLVTYNVLLSWNDVTGGAAGISTGGPVTEALPPRPLVIGFIELSKTQHYLMATVGLLVGVIFVLTILLRRREGKGWLAVKEDETLAASVGIRVTNRKRVAFLLCSTIAAVAGTIYAHWIAFISPSSFSFIHATFDPLAMVIIGGAGTLIGPLVGALVIVGLPELVGELHDFSILIYGLALLIVAMASPGGLTQIIRDGAQRLRTTVNKRKDRRP